MKKFVFFSTHFIGGFCLLWLSYALVNVSLQGLLAESLWAKTLVETSFLISGVIWGNLGWDALKRISEDCTGSYVVFEMARSSAPLTVFLPVFLVAFDSIYKIKVVAVDYAFYWQHGLLLAVFAVMSSLLLLYRRSENALFFEHAPPNSSLKRTNQSLRD